MLREKQSSVGGSASIVSENTGTEVMSSSSESQKKGGKYSAEYHDVESGRDLTEEGGTSPVKANLAEEECEIRPVDANLGSRESPKTMRCGTSLYFVCVCVLVFKLASSVVTAESHTTSTTPLSAAAVITLDHGNFDAMLAQRQLTLVAFTASWCSQCPRLMGRLEAAAGELARVGGDGVVVKSVQVIYQSMCP